MTFLLIILFFAIAFVYASAGFGGGSSYIALLALLAFEPSAIKSTALICNVVVVAGGTFLFWKKGELDFRKMLPLVAVSVPAAFFGAKMPLADEVYFWVLGLSLVGAGLLLLAKNPIFFKNWISETPQPTAGNQSPIANQLLIGGAIGFLSGMVGIGGGIFLAPVLHFMSWDAPRKIAATASFFILANSLAGLAGLFSSGFKTLDFGFVWPLVLAVFVGGQLGSRAVVLKLNPLIIKRITGVLVLWAGVQVLWKSFF